LQPIEERCMITKQKIEDKGVWEMFFDGACSKEGIGAGVWVKSPEEVFSLHSFKLMFNCTNNVVEYEVLMLGLDVLKEKGATKICVKGDSEVVLNHIKGI